MSATGERYADGRMAYRCDRCGVVQAWEASWMWFGSYLQAEAGERVPTYCGTCAAHETHRKGTPPREVKP